MTVTAGDPLGELALTGTDGRPVGLDALRGEAVLLVFLRHLA